MENLFASNFSCTNASTNGVTMDYWKLRGEDVIVGRIAASLFLLFIIFGLPWNILLFVSVIKDKLYKEPSLFLLLNLTLTDIIILILGVPFPMVIGFSGEYIIGNTDRLRCQLCLGIVDVVTLLYNSLFVLALMSVDRFLYIYKPLQYDRLVTKVWILVPILITWLVSIGMGVSSRLVDTKGVVFRPSFLSCIVEAKSIYFVIVLIIIALGSLTVLIACNSCIIYIACKNIKLIYSTRGMDVTNNESTKKPCNKKQLHLFRTFGALLFSQLITWVPLISVVLALIITEDNLNHATITVSLVLFYSQSAIHPFIQTLLIPDVRKSLKKTIRPLLTSKCCSTISKGETAHINKECCSSFFLLRSINGAIRTPSTATTNEVI